MAFFQKLSKTVTPTTAVQSVYTTAMNGYIHGILYEPPAANALDSTNVVTITNEESTGMVVLKFAPTTTPVMYFPRSQVHTSTAAALAPSTAIFIEGARYPFAFDRAKVRTPISGSTAKTGTLRFYIGG